MRENLGVVTAPPFEIDARHGMRGRHRIAPGRGASAWTSGKAWTKRASRDARGEHACSMRHIDLRTTAHSRSRRARRERCNAQTLVAR
ncbi:hypothetical protein [Xanthomonas oryzae pv. oryzae MAFF 311018]|nr:hypothetical protein [Xanthomonas oryzae pv. oryzae MAFF 311018]